MVKHRVTREKFVMKVLAHDAPMAIAQQVESEVLALQTTSKYHWTTELVDYFADAHGNRYIVTKLPKASVAEVFMGSD